MSGFPCIISCLLLLLKEGGKKTWSMAYKIKYTIITTVRLSYWNGGRSSRCQNSMRKIWPCSSTRWRTLIYNSLRKKASKQLTHFRDILCRKTETRLLFYDQTKFGLRLTELSGDRQLVLKGTRKTPEQRRGVAHTSSSVLCLGAGRETTKVESGLHRSVHWRIAVMWSFGLHKFWAKRSIPV